MNVSYEKRVVITMATEEARDLATEVDALDLQDSPTLLSLLYQVTALVD